MTDRMKTTQGTTPSRLSASATYTIGGKKYDAQDVRNTSSQNVHSQSESYKPSEHTQATIRIENTQQGTSYKPTETTSLHNIQTIPYTPSTSHIQTGSEMSRMAENRVQEQVEYYTSNRATVESHNIINGIDNTPRMVETIKTSSMPDVLTTVPKQNTYRPDVPTVGSVESVNYAVSQQQMKDIQENISRMGATSNLTTGNMQYGANIARTYHLTGAVKDNMILSGIGTSRFTSGMGATGGFVRSLGNIASYSISTEAAKALQKWKTESSQNGLITGGKFLLGNAQSSIMENDDLGTQGAGSVISTGMLGASAFKIAQNVTPIGIEGVKMVGNGVYQVTTTAGLAAVTVGRTAKTLINRQVVPMSKEAILVLKNQAQISGLNNTQLVHGIVNKVSNVKNFYNNSLSNIKHIQKRIHSAVDTSVKIVHGIANGTLTINTAASYLQAFKNRAFRGIKTGVKTAVKTTVKGASAGATKLVLRGVPKTAKILEKGLLAGAGVLTRTDNVALQGVGYTVIGTDIGIKTAIVGKKITGYTVKTAVKGGKAAIRGGKSLYAGAKFIKNQGLKRAWDVGRSKATQKLIMASKSVVSFLLTGAKALGMKIVAPLLIICIVATAVAGGISAPVMAVSSIFSGVFGTSDTDTEYNIREYITQKEPTYMSNLINQVSAQMQQSQSRYHIVRFYSNTGNTQPAIIGGQGELIGQFKITAYCPCRICCGKWSYEVTGRPKSTASGATPVQGVTIAVDKNQLPFGTKVYFNNHVYTAQDTGSGIGTNCIDLYFESHQEARNWGVKYMPVYYASNSLTDTTQQVNQVMPNNEQLVNVLQPMFNAILLMNYDLEPTEAEAEALFSEIFNSMFKITTTTSVEQCGQSVTDGTGTVTVHDCGKVHALSNCPNPLVGKHTVFTCADCDSYIYICNGHKGSLNCENKDEDHEHKEWSNKNEPGCYKTIEHVNEDGEKELEADCGNSTKKLKCTGYSYCNSHDVITYKLNMEGAYALENKYFLQPIDRLSSMGSRTQEQEVQLQNLKDYHEIYQELMSQVAVEFGGGLTMSDLSGVNFINGTRVSNQSVVDLALSQVGQKGGEPYWSYYGFQSRVAWCACFVNWCMRNTPSASSSYPHTANNAYCQTIANHFKSIGQWGNKNYTNLVAGDTIFFDWEVDGHTDHIGIVIGRDENYVYTVEGNSSDAVNVKQYALGSSVIYGYGLMNY